MQTGLFAISEELFADAQQGKGGGGEWDKKDEEWMAQDNHSN